MPRKPNISDTEKTPDRNRIYPLVGELKVLVKFVGQFRYLDHPLREIYTAIMCNTHTVVVGNTSSSIKFSGSFKGLEMMKLSTPKRVDANADWIRLYPLIRDCIPADSIQTTVDNMVSRINSNTVLSKDDFLVISAFIVRWLLLEKHSDVLVKYTRTYELRKWVGHNDYSNARMISANALLQSSLGAHQDFNIFSRPKALVRILLANLHISEADAEETSPLTPRAPPLSADTPVIERLSNICSQMGHNATPAAFLQHAIQVVLEENDFEDADIGTMISKSLDISEHRVAFKTEMTFAQLTALLPSNAANPFILPYYFLQKSFWVGGSFHLPLVTHFHLETLPIKLLEYSSVEHLNYFHCVLLCCLCAVVGDCVYAGTHGAPPTHRLHMKYTKNDRLHIGMVDQESNSVSSISAFLNLV